MGKKLLCIFFLPLNIIATYGQSNVWEMPTVSIDTSIVRYWNQDNYFVYMVTQSGTKSFEFHDNVSNITYGANLDPQVTINDFQIGHDSIFAGGTVNLSGESMSASPILFNNLIGTPTACGVYGAAPVSTSFPKLNGASSHHHVSVLPFYTYGSYPLVITNKTINTICQ